MKSRFLTLTALFLLLSLPACVTLAPTEVPLPAIKNENAGSRKDALVIMLPGRGDRATTFIREGFEQAGKQRGFDTIAVDAHFGYYRERTLLPRLHEDIVLPARADGYKRVWLLGISMGGYGALLYASQHPDLVDGVILLAPFLGSRDAIDEIRNSGGLSNWSENASELRDHEIAIWAWLQNATQQEEPTPILLGYGLSDPMAEAYDSLTEALDPSSVYTHEGGHKWTTWSPLWTKIAADVAVAIRL